MKLKHTEVLIDHLTVKEDPNKCIKQAHSEICAAVDSVKWPLGSDLFRVNPIKKGNGVVPIKKAFQESLGASDWRLEHRMSLGKGISPGPIDAVKRFPSGLVAVEWETGNISSSHRSLNRMALGILNKELVAGFLVLPSRAFYTYLTDRVGNFREIAPYFPIWKALDTQTTGYLAVMEVEHDVEDNSVDLLKKGTDGRALK